jgi:hypothetical protein
MFAETTVDRGHVKHGQDDSAYVRFHKFNEKGVAKDFIEIMFPGDARTIVHRAVKEDDMHRWPKQWQAYQAGEEFKAEGFPLEQWPEIDDGMVRDLNHKRIYTVEQLSAVTDQNLVNLGLGARELVAKAKAFADVRKDSAAVSKYAAQAEQALAENALLREQLSELSKRLQSIEEAKDDTDAPRRGRPRKEAV